jgi:hypothetical protein
VERALEKFQAVGWNFQCGSPTHANGREKSVCVRNSRPLLGYSSVGMGASAVTVRRLAGKGIRLGLPLPFFLLQPFPILEFKS